MNPSDSILYPASYFRDMAFFVTKCMTNIFDEKPSLSRSSSMESLSDGPSPPFQNSATPVIAAAIDGHFSSDWESQLYQFILAISQRSMLDESVIIGTVVLLDLLGDLHKMGRFMDGYKSRLVLAPYPHKDYLSYYIGAFMLAHRLLSHEGPRDKMFWEEVIGDDVILNLGDVDALEDDFREILGKNVDYYPSPPRCPDDPANLFFYAGDVVIRPNPFIPRLKYLKMKEKMYAHIRVRMTSRGEEVLRMHPTVWRKRDLALHFSPCHAYMIDKQIFFAQTRREFPHLEEATDEEVNAFLEATCYEMRPEDRIGLGIGTI